MIISKMAWQCWLNYTELSKQQITDPLANRDFQVRKYTVKQKAHVFLALSSKASIGLELLCNPSKSWMSGPWLLSTNGPGS